MSNSSYLLIVTVALHADFSDFCSWRIASVVGRWHFNLKICSVVDQCSISCISFTGGICFGILWNIIGRARSLKLVNSCFLIKSIIQLFCLRKSDTKSSSNSMSILKIYVLSQMLKGTYLGDENKYYVSNLWGCISLDVELLSF